MTSKDCPAKQLTQTVKNKYSYEDYMKIADHIKRNVPSKPDVLVIFGSGLGAIAEMLQNPIQLNYSDIPNFPVSTIAGHAGKLVFGVLSNLNIVCMQGRFHYYEGYTLEECTLPIRVLALLGVRYLFVTNAAGGVNEKYKTGDIMLLKDHVNFLGFGGSNPLRGPNETKFGARFIPVNKAYDKTIINKAKEIANKIGLGSNVHEGVYAMVGGPNYETIAEVRLLRSLGIDAVGMSTIPEVLVAKHCGITVFGLSIITNECISSYDDEREPNHEEVLSMVKMRSDQLKQFFLELIKNLEGR